MFFTQVRPHITRQYSPSPGNSSLASHLTNTSPQWQLLPCTPQKTKPKPLRSISEGEDFICRANFHSEQMCHPRKACVRWAPHNSIPATPDPITAPSLPPLIPPQLPIPISHLLNVLPSSPPFSGAPPSALHRERKDIGHMMFGSHPTPSLHFSSTSTSSSLISPFFFPPSQLNFPLRSPFSFTLFFCFYLFIQPLLKKLKLLFLFSFC